MKKNKKLFVILLIIILFLLFIFRFGFLIMFMIGGNERPTKEKLKELLVEHEIDSTMTVFSDSLEKRMKCKDVNSFTPFEEGSKKECFVGILLENDIFLNKQIDSSKLEEMKFQIANSLKIKNGFRGGDVIVSWTWYDKQHNRKTAWFRVPADSLFAPSPPGRDL